jgi:GT2 family glycosyltransferase
MMNKDVALIMVTFGRLGLLKTTLRTLFDTINHDRVSVSIIDNHSNSDVCALLTRYNDKIDRLIFLNDNYGKPYAWNIGAHLAQIQCKATGCISPKYFLFCDSDLKFNPNWLNPLVDAYEDHKELPLCGLSGYLHPPHLNSGKVCEGERESIIEVRFPPGCCVLMSINAFKKNGLWDTRRKIRTVDTSYFRNAIGRGFHNASLTRSVIEHTGKKQRTWNIANGKPKYIK